MPDQDDAQSSGENESGGATSSASTVGDTASTDTQDSQEEEQSAEGETQEGKGGEKLYKLPDGREVTGDEVYKIYSQDLLPEFNRRSQRLADLEKQDKERSARAEDETRQSIADNPYLKNVTPEVREAIVQIVKPVLDESLQQRDQVAAQQERDRAFQATAEALKREFPGGDGRPKFDEKEVIQAMQDPNNTNFDLRSKFIEIHQNEFRDFWVKEALKKQKGGTQSERTGGSGPRKPDRKVPRTIQEAGDALMARLKQSS